MLLRDLAFVDDHGGAEEWNETRMVEYNFAYYAVSVDDLMLLHDGLLLLQAPAVACFLVNDVEMRNLTSWISLKLIEAKMNWQKMDEKKVVGLKLVSVNCLFDKGLTINSVVANVEHDLFAGSHRGALMDDDALKAYVFFKTHLENIK